MSAPPTTSPSKNHSIYRDSVIYQRSPLRLNGEFGILCGMHENTLHWNPKRRNADGKFIGGGIEGRYRGVEMVAGRGTAYQFGIGRDVYTVYWTGLLVYGEPEFRHVDTDRPYTARFADWFDLLANITL